MKEWQRKGAEHPCYGCRINDCEVRQVEYHNNSKRYIVQPKIIV